jgi:hypothetical protein
VLPRLLELWRVNPGSRQAAWLALVPTVGGLAPATDQAYHFRLSGRVCVMRASHWVMLIVGLAVVACYAAL